MPISGDEPVRAEFDHLVEQRRDAALDQRPDEIVPIRAHRDSRRRNGIRGDAGGQILRHLVVELADELDQVLVTGFAERLFGPEMVPHQAQRHPGFHRDAPDRGALETVLAEVSHRRVADAGARGQVVGVGHDIVAIRMNSMLYACIAIAPG